MGIAGLVLGILGAIGGFIPGINFFAWAVCVVGIILSAIAMSKAKKDGLPTGAAIAGLVLSIIGLVFSLIGLACVSLCAAGAAGLGAGLL